MASGTGLVSSIPLGRELFGRGLPGAPRPMVDGTNDGLVVQSRPLRGHRRTLRAWPARLKRATGTGLRLDHRPLWCISAGRSSEALSMGKRRGMRTLIPRPCRWCRVRGDLVGPDTIDHNLGRPTPVVIEPVAALPDPAATTGRPALQRVRCRTPMKRLNGTLQPVKYARGPMAYRHLRHQECRPQDPRLTL